jgi:hypothetical protein
MQTQEKHSKDQKHNNIYEGIIVFLKLGSMFLMGEKWPRATKRAHIKKPKTLLLRDNLYWPLGYICET